MDWMVSTVAKYKSVTLLEPKIIYQCCIDTNNMMLVDIELVILRLITTFLKFIKYEIKQVNSTSTFSRVISIDEIKSFIIEW